MENEIYKMVGATAIPTAKDRNDILLHYDENTKQWTCSGWSGAWIGQSYNWLVYDWEPLFATCENFTKKQFIEMLIELIDTCEECAENRIKEKN